MADNFLFCTSCKQKFNLGKINRLKMCNALKYLLFRTIWRCFALAAPSRLLSSNLQPMSDNKTAKWKDPMHRMLFSHSEVSKYINFIFNFFNSAIFHRFSILPKDFYVIGLILRGDDLEAQAAVKTNQKPQKKEKCGSLCFNCNVRALKMCNRCNRSMCDSCFKRSHDFPNFEDHQLVEKPPNPKSIFHRYYADHFCPIHDANQTLFCRDCSKLICLVCNRLCKNQLHNIVTVETEVS